MDYQEYYAAREQIVKIMREDLLGPLEEEEVIVDESPVSYYLVGKLYPRNIHEINENGDCIIAEDEQVFEEDDAFAFGNNSYPSAMGFTCAISDETESFRLHVKAAYYEYEEMQVDKEGKKKSEYGVRWIRKGIDYQSEIDVSIFENQYLHTFIIHGNLELQIQVHFSQLDNCKKLTITLVNRNYAENEGYVNLSKLTYFQPEIVIDNLQGGSFQELYRRSPNIDDRELRELELLYHESASYASGHGCSAKYTSNEQGKVIAIASQVIPEYELLQMKPAMCMEGNLLSMKLLSMMSYEQVTFEIQILIDKYRIWIEQQRKSIAKMDSDMRQAAHGNLEKCENTCKRIERVIDILKDPDVLRAFQLTNEVMYLQRKRMSAIKDEDIKWYPFQIAFILQEIESIVRPESLIHEKVDLLWFPTGGGKTEAYLGIAAFTILYRRIRELKRGNVDEGVAVIMRYTLRLLSFQQFERATAMICAAELIRIREKLGDEKFGIGLWAGSSLTPNNLDEVEDFLLRGKRNNVANPIQIKKCPWCGHYLDEKDYSIDRRAKRMMIRCANKSCDFTKGLPIYLIDEEIYEYKPSFIIGTVDKFAQLAFKEEAGLLLGVDLQTPPELIIQDELHLISGPLGTVAGIYEPAILKLCERNGIGPKIIASTATIRNAGEQIMSLYGKNYEQFPPQGITINDSFFAKQSQIEEKPARKYVGLFATGVSKAVAFNRIMGSLLFATRYLVDAGYSEKVIDSFWTQTGYFNNLKELGSALVRVIDSVQDRYQYLKNAKFSKKYVISSEKKRYVKMYEMTSRNNSADLGNIIQNELLIPYTHKGEKEPYDFLLASNMISVGVDVARLGTMLVVGQPIKTSEYIQATSRVGRTTPGLVLTMYYPNNSRDRSHYEQFYDYHATLYKYVEATSLTPFADRSRDRALQALYIILCRFTIKQLRPNTGAALYKRNMDGLDKIREYIKEYVLRVDPDEVNNVMAEIAALELEWEEKTVNKQLVYYKFIKDEDTLFKEDYQEGERFRMMNSMRSVEPDIGVTTEE